MNADQLKTAGFSDAEVSEYTKLQQAGFSPQEIEAHYAGKAAATEPPKKSWGRTRAGIMQEAKAAEDAPPESTGNRYQDEYLASLSGLQKFAIGAGAGLMNVVKGAEQLATAGGTRERITRDYERDRALYEPLRKRSAAAKVGQFVGEMAPFMLVPGVAPEVSLAAKAGVGALTGAGLGALQYVPPGGSREANALVGGTLGAAVPLAIGGGSKIVNALRGAVPPTAIDAQAAKLGVPLTRGEVLDDPALLRRETLMERLPKWMGGLGRFREKQHEAADSAAKGFFAKYVRDPSAATTAEMKVANDAHLDALYDAVRTQTANVPKAEASEVWQAATGVLDRFPSVFEEIQDNHVKRILKGIATDTAPHTEQVLNARGFPAGTTTTKPKFSFNDLWELREGLGKEMQDAKTDTARGVYRSLYRAVSEDMDSMLSSSNAPALQDFKAANEAFKRYSVKFDALRTAYDKAMGTTGAGKVFSPKRFSTALKNLANDPKSQRRLQWSPNEIDEMTGLANVMQAVERAGARFENPPTGSRYGPAVAAAEIAVHPGAVGKLAGLAGAGWVENFLTTTTAGKALSRAASRVDMNSPAGTAILRQMEKLAQRGAVSTGTSPRPSVEAMP